MASAVLDLIVNLKDEASAGLGGIASSAGSMLGPLALVAGGVVAVGGALTGAVASAATFEGSMGKLSAVTGLSGDEMKEFSDLALKMGMETAYSAQEAADAMIELAKGGIDPATIKAGGLKAALDLAAAGGLELATSAEILAKQLGVWATDGVKAADVADLMAQAANASTVDVDELAVGMANVGGVAKVAGAKFQDVVTTMAMIAPGFSSASDAGTSLKAVFNNLQPSTKAAKTAFKELGLITAEGNNVFYDAQGNFVGMQKAADLLADALDDLTPAQRASALETMFGSDGMRAAAMIAEKAGEGYDNVAGAMTKAGTAAEQAAKMNQGLAKAWDALKGSVETIGIVVGMMLLPLLTTLVTDVLTPAVNAVLAFAQSFADGSTTISVSGENLGVVFETIQGVVQAVLPLIQGIVTTVLAIVADLWQTHGDDILSFASAAWESIQSIIATIAAIVGAVITAWLTVYKNVIETNMDTIKTIFGVVWDAIKLIIGTALTLIDGLLKTALALIKGDWDTAWNTIKTTFDTIWNNIVTILTPLVEDIKRIIKTGIETAKTTINTILGDIKTLFTNTWNDIVTGINNKIEDAKTAIRNMVNGMKSAVDGAIGAVKSALLDPIQSAVDTIKGLIDGLWTNFNNLKAAAAAWIPPSWTAPSVPVPGGRNPVNGQPLPPPGFGATNARGSGITINIDARGASASEVEKAVDAALRKAGLRADSRIKLA